MSKLIAFGIVFCLTIGPAHAKVMPSSKAVLNHNDEDQDTPSCVNVNQKNVLGYAIVVHSTAFVVAQGGGTDEVEAELTTVENQLASLAIKGMYDFALHRKEMKCWSLTAPQTKALLKAVGVMAVYVRNHQLQDKVTEIIKNNVGVDRAVLAYEDAIKVTEELRKRVE